MKNITFLFFIGLFFSCSYSQDVKLVNSIEFKKAVKDKNSLIIDVRTPEEFKQGHIDNATNINFFDADFEAKIAKLDKKKKVYVYCAAGGRSAKAADKFVSKGFKEVFDLKGGFQSFK